MNTARGVWLSRLVLWVLVSSPFNLPAEDDTDFNDDFYGSEAPPN